MGIACLVRMLPDDVGGLMIKDHIVGIVQRNKACFAKRNLTDSLYQGSQPDIQNQDADDRLLIRRINRGADSYNCISCADILVGGSDARAFSLRNQSIIWPRSNIPSGLGNVVIGLQNLTGADAADAYSLKRFRIISLHILQDGHQIPVVRGLVKAFPVGLYFTDGFLYNGNRSCGFCNGEIFLKEQVYCLSGGIGLAVKTFLLEIAEHLADPAVQNQAGRCQNNEQREQDADQKFCHDASAGATRPF